MARKPAAVEIVLDKIVQFGYPLLSANPYLWTVFFKADGSTLSVNAGGTVDGNCVVFPSPGSHGNLGSQIPEFITQWVTPYHINGYNWPYDTINLLRWTIPDALGSFSTTIEPIPLAPVVQEALMMEDKAGVFGVIAILMSDGGSLPERALEWGHQILNSEVEGAINSLIRILGINHQSITDEDINGIIAGVSEKVTAAIKGDLDIFEELATVNKNVDYAIMQVVVQGDQDQRGVTNIVKYTGTNVFGDWPNYHYAEDDSNEFAITGTITVGDTCPADSLNNVFEQIFEAFGKPDKQEAADWHGAMREFQKAGDLERRPGLSHWWDLASRHVSHLTTLTYSDEKFRESLRKILDELPVLIASPDKKVTKKFLESSAHILEKIITGSPRTELRNAAITGLSLLRHFPEPNFSQLLDLAEKQHPGATRPPRKMKDKDRK